MAGVKGKSGGPRNNSGGTRPGAGRKPKAVPVVKSANTRTKTSGVGKVDPKPLPNENQSKVDAYLKDGRDMLKLLQDVALGMVEASPIQVRAAIAAVQYTHTKRGDGGKKEEVADKAKNAAAGKFSATAPPLKLVRAS